MKAFVSSTYRDLKNHRAYVIERLRRGGIVVDPMEMWTAASDEPKELSQERVKDCDVCILLVGFRRGHIPDGEKLSITQMEYREALRREMDVLVFMANEDADWPTEAIEELKTDPEIKRWRDELKEHRIVEFFTPRPESIDVSSGLLRLYEKRESAGKKNVAVDDEQFAIEVRAYSNSSGVLLAWRTEKPIKGCLGFSIRRKVLGDAVVAEDKLGSRIGFADQTPLPLPAGTNDPPPIQNFRWVDPLPMGQEARYRIVPMIGQPRKLSEPAEADASSNWTRWVASQTGQTPGYRVFFNNVSAIGFSQKIRGPEAKKLQRLMQKESTEIRQYCGGELRNTLLQLLKQSKQTDGRVYGRVSEIDDPEITAALADLGNNLSLILDPANKNNRSVRNRLGKSGVKIYEQRSRKKPSCHGNFAVFCDRWGTPNQVWLGNAAWTIESFCLRANSGLLVESVALARICLDRWEAFRDAHDSSKLKTPKAGLKPIQLSFHEASLTLWNTPLKNKADTKDVLRLIRGARQGVLYVLNENLTADDLADELRENEGADLFIQGIFYARQKLTLQNLHKDRGAQVLMNIAPIESNIILIDPFGPHPVIILGPHPSGRQSGSSESNLIIENAHGLATEYAAYIIRLYDRYRFRVAATSMGRSSYAWKLQSNDLWQDHYFEGAKKTEFNFLFGTLSPGS